MKQRLLFLLLCVFLAGGTQTADAQSFWKKLGKVAQGLANAVGNSATTSDASSSSSSSSSQTTAGDQSRAMTLKVTNCLRAGTKGLRVDFELVNTADTYQKVEPEWIAATIGGQGMQPEVFLLGNDRFTTANNFECFTWVMPHCSLQCRAYFKDVPNSIKTMDGFALSGYFFTSANGATTSDVGTKAQKRCAAMAITELPASNVEKCKVTDPDMLLTVKSIKRSGSNVLLTFALKNNTAFNKYFCLGEYEAHDASGTSYKKTSYSGNGLTAGGKQLWAMTSLRLLAGASSTYVLTIENIPTSQTELSLVRIPMSISDRKRDTQNGRTTTRQVWDNFTIDFRNLKINTTY